MTEVLDLVAVRMFPLLEHDARGARRQFPGAAALDGFRGGPRWRATRSCSSLLAVGGVDGLAAQLGDELSELECNPVLVTTTDAIALDARLVLGDPPPTCRSRRRRPTSPRCSRHGRRGGRRVDHPLDLRQPLARRVPQRRLERASVRVAPGRRRGRRRARVRRRRRHAGADRLPARGRARDAVRRRDPRHRRAGAVHPRDQRRVRRGRCRRRRVEPGPARRRARGEDTRASGRTASASTARPGARPSSSTCRARSGR